MSTELTVVLYIVYAYVQAILIARTDKYLQEMPFIVLTMVAAPFMTVGVILAGFVKLTYWLMKVKK